MSSDEHETIILVVVGSSSFLPLLKPLEPPPLPLNFELTPELPGEEKMSRLAQIVQASHDDVMKQKLKGSNPRPYPSNLRKVPQKTLRGTGKGYIPSQSARRKP